MKKLVLFFGGLAMLFGMSSASATEYYYHGPAAADRLAFHVGEAEAYLAESDCLFSSIGRCGPDVECLSQLNNAIKNTDEKIDEHLDYIPSNAPSAQGLAAQQATASVSSGISKSQAIEVAQEAALANGVAQDWFGGDISTRFIDGRWVIHFYSKPDPETGEIMFGNHFTAYVSVDGTIVKFDPGR